MVFNTPEKAHQTLFSIADLYLDNGRDQSWDRAVSLFVRLRWPADKKRQSEAEALVVEMKAE